MIRALYDLRALAKDTRTQLFAMRTTFKRGNVPDKIRFRMKSRLILLNLRFLDVAQAVRDLKDLTAAQAMTTRRELGGINAAIRDCNRMLAAAALAAAETPPPVPGDYAWAEAPAGEPVQTSWDDMPAGVPVEPGDVTFLDGGEGGDWLDAVAPLPEEEGVELASLPPWPAGMCPVCGDSDHADEVHCPRCRVGYHRECWDYSAGCAIYGCRGAA
jgi:hypothetical protein